MRGLLRNAPRSLFQVAIALVVFTLGLAIIGRSHPPSGGRALSPEEMATIFGDAGGQQSLCLYAGKCADTFPGMLEGSTVCQNCEKADGTGPDTYNYCCATQQLNTKLCTQTTNAACDPAVYFVWYSGVYTNPQSSCGTCNVTGQLTQSKWACNVSQYTGTACQN